MAKKKPVIQLSSKNITFSENERHFKVISFNQEYMTVLCSETEGGVKRQLDLPFAHLPRDVKTLVRPLR